MTRYHFQKREGRNVKNGGDGAKKQVTEDDKEKVWKCIDAEDFLKMTRKFMLRS